jgi:hypothetical protein
MTRIASASNNPQAPKAKPAPTAPVAPPARATAPVAQGFRPLLQQAAAIQAQLAKAVEAGQFNAARRLQSQLKATLSAASRAPGGTPERQALLNRAAAAMQTIDRQLMAAPRPAATPAPAARPAENRGPLGFLGDAFKQVGSGLEKAGKVVFFPLEALGKVVDPLRAKAGEKLGQLKSAIDNSVIGKAPVIGTATRFTTGLASSLVGMVDGAVQAVTHPVDLIKGVGKIAGTVVGLIPGPKQAWDYAVHGKDFATSYQEGLADAKALGKAFIQPALDDFAAGNYAGGIGRLTGDIGSLLVTGGAAGGAKTAQVGMVASRAGKLGKVVNAVKAGARVIGAVDDLSAKIIGAGLKANLAPVKALGRVASEAAPLRKLASMADEAAQAQAAVAAVATKPKAAYAFADDLLKGEVRMANAPDLAQSIANQKTVVGKLGGTPIYEHLSDLVRGSLVDNEAKLIGAMKELKLNGKAITSLEEAAEAWKALPADSPQRVVVGKKLAGALQEGFAEGLSFPPAAIEFTGLPEHLAGLQKADKVLLDPSLLNEDLGYLVNVMAEEQTHAYQRFLADNREALTVDPRVAAEVEKYAKELQAEHYLSPPAAGLQTLAGGMDELNRVIRSMTDSADEVVARNLRKEAAPKLAAGTAERAALDGWWGQVGQESEKLSFMKWALGDLDKAAKHPTSLKTWIGDYADRLPEGIALVDGVARDADGIRAALSGAIKESQGAIVKANNEVATLFKDWTTAYKSQSLEFTAKNVASDVARWMFGD